MPEWLSLTLAAMIAISPVPSTAATGEALVPRSGDIAGEIDHAIEAGRLMQARLMIDATPELAIYRRARALALLDLADGRSAKAFTDLQALLAQQPDDALALEGAGLAAARIGRDDASNYLERCLAADSRRWRAWNALAVLADRAHDWVASAAAYRHGLAASADNTAILNNMGYSLMMQARAAEAVDVLQTAFLIAPLDRTVENNLIVARAMQGDRPDVQAVEPSRAAYLLNNAGYGFWLRGDTTTARSMFDAAVRASPVDYAIARDNLRLLAP